jgi:hypothetical protein
LAPAQSVVVADKVFRDIIGGMHDYTAIAGAVIYAFSSPSSLSDLPCLPLYISPVA